MFFEAEADSLISRGLAAFLILTYNGQSPIDILQHNPEFLKEIEIESSLSMTRAGGLSHILLRIKQDALQLVAH